MSVGNFVLPGLALGFGAVLIKPRRSFNFKGSTLIPQATLEELHRDDLVITEHPVEQGAPIADHAYKQPAEVVIHCGWSNSPASPTGLTGIAVGAASTFGGPFVGSILSAGQTIRAATSILGGNSPTQARAIYEQLLQVQASRAVFDIYTGKRAYKNMLFQSLMVRTADDSENILDLTAVCRQVIIVQTRVVSVPINTDPQSQAAPEKTAPLEDMGQQQLLDAPNFVPDALSLPEAASSAFESVQSGITDVTAQLPGLVDQVSSGLSSTLDTLKATVTATLDPLVTQLPGALQSLNAQLATAAQAIQGGLPSVISGVQAQIPAALSSLETTITSAIQQVPRAFEIPFTQ